LGNVLTFVTELLTLQSSLKIAQNQKTFSWSRGHTCLSACILKVNDKKFNGIFIGVKLVSKNVARKAAAHFAPSK